MIAADRKHSTRETMEAAGIEPREIPPPRRHRLHGTRTHGLLHGKRNRRPDDTPRDPRNPTLLCCQGSVGYLLQALVEVAGEGALDAAACLPGRLAGGE